MRILLESARPHTIPLGSLIASVALHLGFGVPVWQEAVHASQEARPESFITRALFLPPPDRRLSRTTPGERIAWSELGTVGTGLYAPVGPPGEGQAGRTDAAADTRPAIALGDDVGAVPAPGGADTAYSIFEVDEAVTRMADSDGPMYPNDLLQQMREGVVAMRYVVSADGGVDTASAQVLGSTHPHFTRAVLAALARMRFMPAKINGTPVSQLVEQEFAFRIRPPDVASAAEGARSPER